MIANSDKDWIFKGTHAKKLLELGIFQKNTKAASKKTSNIAENICSWTFDRKQLWLVNKGLKFA